jgi:hypothetical protein
MTAAPDYVGSGITDGLNIGRSTTDKIGFYGLATPIVQPASSAIATLAVTSATAGGFGFTTSAQFEAAVAQLKAITSALRGLGIVASA